MRKRVIFSIYIDIPDHRLDDPGDYDRVTGEFRSTNKSHNTKSQFKCYYERLKKRQRAYADHCDAEYLLYEYDDDYEKFARNFNIIYPEISEYDIINFYKHNLMRKLADYYDDIVYFDFDVIPTTDKILFDEFDMKVFNVGSSNENSMDGRTRDPRDYNLCIRNPASKYYNAQAMAYECDMNSLYDVFNTGIMFANSYTIKNLNYFEGFSDNIIMMKKLIEEHDSMYPKNIQRAFGYDNETLMSHRLNETNTKYRMLPTVWNTTSLKPNDLDNAHLVHVISKRFELLI